VEIRGLSSRPELNGAVGEILGTATDESGRVAVRVRDCPGASGERQLRIQPRCLLRVGAPATADVMSGQQALVASMSLPSLHPVLEGDFGRVSASRGGGSIAASSQARSLRSVAGRSLGPAIGAGARGTIGGRTMSASGRSQRSMASSGIISESEEELVAVRKQPPYPYASIHLPYKR